jgi:hypothetical protein
MVRRAYRQRTLVEVLLPDADKLWDPTLRRIDTLLDDEVLVDRVAAAIGPALPVGTRPGSTHRPVRSRPTPGGCRRRVRFPK